MYSVLIPIVVVSGIVVAVGVPVLIVGEVIRLATARGRRQAGR